MLRIVILGLLLSFVTCFSHVLGQGGKESYRQAYDQLVRMLDGKDSLSFKKAVFITENAYFDNTLSYDKFNAQITAFSAICRQIGDQGKFTDVRNNLPYNWSIYKFITDTLPFTFQGDTITKLPYRYDTLDPTGEKDVINTFVLKLISTGTGNCRSLPYLYKILADELKAEAGFALAPYHLYIKHYDAPNRYNERRVYNVELTNGSFPRDGWIVASSYITWTSIKRGMFGVRLDDKKTIALCLGDLAVSYERKFGTDDFLIQLYHTALKYHPVNAQNRLRLAETYRKTGKVSLADSICKALVFDGYREMPDQMYNMWLSEIRRDKDALHSDTSRTYEAPKDIFGNPMPTLSKGKFKEDADLTDSTRVGSVVVDCETGKVIRYLKEWRIYDVSRFLSVDPLTKDFPWYSPYQFAGNQPIWAIDLDGLEELIIHALQLSKVRMGGTELDISNSDAIVYELSFELKYPNGDSKRLNMSPNLIMFADKTQQISGDQKLNALQDGQNLNLNWQAFSDGRYNKKESIYIDPKFENGVQTYAIETFIHPAGGTDELGGCKGVCPDDQFQIDNERLKVNPNNQLQKTPGKVSQDAMYKINDLYNQASKDVASKGFKSMGFKLSVGTTAPPNRNDIKFIPPSSASDSLPDLSDFKE